MADPTPEDQQVAHRKTVAETRKLEAETLKLEVEAEAARERAAAETAKLKAEAEAAAAMAQKNVAEAISAEHMAKMTAIGLEERERERALVHASDWYHHRYAFVGQVNDKSVRECMSHLAAWVRMDPVCEIEICFTSPGGSAIDGFALWDYIQQVRATGHRVTTSTIGMAASMGAILLQAGDHRVMGSESYLLIHEISTIVGGKVGEIEDDLEFTKRMQERVLDIFAKRSKLTRAELARRWRRKDWWIDSTDALKWGLVDEVR